MSAAAREEWIQSLGDRKKFLAELAANTELCNHVCEMVGWCTASDRPTQRDRLVELAGHIERELRMRSVELHPDYVDVQDEAA